MKITGFCPIIVTQNQEAAVKVFEALGFERRHHKTDIEEGRNESIAMKDANGNRINIASSKIIPRDLTAININVDDFDEAYALLLSLGFVNSRGDKVTETPSAKSTMLFSESGFGITLTQHIK